MRRESVGEGGWGSERDGWMDEERDEYRER